MEFQNKVDLMPVIGVEGAHASVNPIVSDPLGRLAGEDLYAGRFCWLDDDDKYTGVNTNAVAPHGFVVRNLSHGYTEDSLLIRAGEVPNVAFSGDFYVKTTNDAEAGNVVFAKNDGTIVAGAAGDVIANAIETSYKVIRGGLANEIIVIGNYQR